jgi:hypothetical protein
MHDPNLDGLLAVDPEVLAWFALLIYACGYDAANGAGRCAVADERIAALVDTAAAAWRKRQRLEAPRRPAWLEHLVNAQPGVEPWEEMV